MRARSLMLGSLAAVVCLAPGPTTADGAADALAAAADRVVESVRSGDKAALEALAAKDDPDPWDVADLLLTRGARDAAAAFAGASPRPDVEALPAYVRGAGDPRSEESGRAVLAAAREALRARDGTRALELLGPAEKGPDTVLSVRLRFTRANAQHNLKRFAEAADAWEAAGAAALRLGWLAYAVNAFDKGRNACWRSPDLKRALGFAERVLALQERRGLEKAVTDAMVNVGSLHDALDDQKRALEVMEKALARYEAQGDQRGVANAVGNMGVIRWKLGELDAAMRLQERALVLAEELKDRAQKARTHARLGLIYRDRGDLPRALEACQFAAQELGPLGFAGEAALALVSVSNIHRDMGNEARALGALDRAIAVARKAGDGIAEARALFNLGTLRARLGDAELSTKLREQAMAIWERAGDRRAVAIGLFSLAGSHVARREPERALALLDRAQRIADEMHSDELRTGVERTRADALVALGRLDEALPLAESAARRAEARANLQEVADTALALGDVRDARGEHAEALKAMRRASEAARATRSAGAELAALSGEARSLRALGDLAGAVAAARKVAANLETFGRGQDDESGASVRRRGMRALDQGALAAQALGDVDAFVEFLEAGRAGALLAALGSGDVLRAEGLPEALAVEDAKARAREAEALARFTRALTRRGADVDARGADLDAAREHRREISRRIQRWARITGGAAAPGVASREEISRALAPGDVLVLYAYLGSNLVAAAVRPGGARMVTLAARLAVERAVEGVLPQTHEVLPSEAIAAARKTVLGPLALGPEDRRLLVSPDGPLDRVPFPLLEPDREVVFVPSGSVLGLLRARGSVIGEGVLALGDPVYDASGGAGDGGLRAGLGLPRLVASAAEAQAVGDVVLLGPQASEQGLRDALATRPRWRAVHLACHGLIDADRPLLSALALTPSDEDDGLLTGHEILRLAVPADLVVLSGCETARGKAFWGEGVVGLTRAFLLAGAQRVLASLWKVDDEATRVFMEAFYGAWKKGERLDAALQHARAHLRADPRFSHPKHWAAFVLWGLPE